MLGCRNRREVSPLPQRMLHMKINMKSLSIDDKRLGPECFFVIHLRSFHSAKRRRALFGCESPVLSQSKAIATSSSADMRILSPSSST